MTVEQNIAFPLRIRKMATDEIKPPCRRDRRTRRPARPREEAAVQAFGRPAAARGACPRAGVRAGRAAARRAVLGARQEPARNRCRRRSGVCTRRPARPSSSSRTTRARRWRCHRASRSSTTASCCRSARRSEVYERPANRFVAEFLGEINMLPLTDVRHDKAGATGSVRASARSGPSAAATASAAAPCSPYDPSTCRSRPRRTAGEQRHRGDGDGVDLSRLRHAARTADDAGAKLTLSVPTATIASAARHGPARLAHLAGGTGFPASGRRLTEAEQAQPRRHQKQQGELP